MGGARTGLALSCWDDIRDRGPSSWWLQGSPVHALFGQGVPEGPASKLGFAAQLFLNSEDLIVLGQALGSARGTSLDLPSAEPHHQVCDESVLSFPRSVGHHDAPAIGLGQLTPKERAEARSCDAPCLAPPSSESFPSSFSWSLTLTPSSPKRETFREQHPSGCQKPFPRLLTPAGTRSRSRSGSL